MEKKGSDRYDFESYGTASIDFGLSCSPPVTLNKDGSTQVSIVWVGLNGDEIVCTHQNLYRKLKNIQRDARVALSMVTGGKTNGLDNKKR